jgi:50S ribosomal protein L16 3-hydroxylase
VKSDRLVGRCRKDCGADSLPRRFWSKFADQNWEKRPLLIRRPFSKPLLSETELSHAIFAASEAYRADPASVSLQFFVGHSQAIADIRKFLPVAEDSDIGGYATRLSRALDKHDFALSIQHVQEYAPEVWLRLREFLSTASQFVPLPDDFTKATLFFGSYRKEARGIHLGNSSNFKFVVHGKKRMRFWPSRFFRGQKGVSHSTNYEQFLPAATTLEATAGDIIYWPSDSWHVVECVDGLAASISLALFVQSRSSRILDFWRHARDVIEERAPRADMVPKLHRAMASILNKESTRREIASNLTADWLNRATGFGFERIPPPRPHQPLHDDVAVRGDRRYPILWSRAADGEIVCSVNGNAFVVTAHRQISRILRRLNSGRLCRVGDLIGNGDEEPAIRESIRSFLEKIHSFRGVSETSKF